MNITAFYYTCFKNMSKIFIPFKTVKTCYEIKMDHVKNKFLIN